MSRALRGDKYDGGTPYYADHLAALQDVDVMTNISNPSGLEVRGYVRLMMKRADDKNVGTPATCKDPMVAIACALNPDDAACPVECRDAIIPDETKAGDLNVSIDSQLDNNTSVPQVGTITLATLEFAASSKDVTVRSLDLEKV